VKVRRVLIYEGEEHDIIRTLERSYVSTAPISPGGCRMWEEQLSVIDQETGREDFMEPVPRLVQVDGCGDGWGDK